MTISEFEIKRCERELKAFLTVRRPPVHIRNELDFGYRINNQSVELIEIRPVWNNPEKKMENPFAKATYNKAKKHWQVYWMRADLKWHAYEPNAAVRSIEDFLSIVADDKHGCFFG